MKYDLIQGDVLERLRELPSESVQVCVTSPPYWNLRDYGVPGQIGLEPTLDAYVCKMVEIFAEVRRVLRSDGTLWLNIGDSYAGSGKGPTGSNGLGQHEKRQGFDSPPVVIPSGLKPKDLCMVPSRVALALQADGWYLRSEIVWAKRAPMPESVTDRPTSAHEKIFLLSKAATYYYDANAVREGACPDTTLRDRDSTKLNNTPGRSRMGGLVHNSYETRNLRNVWHLSPEPFAEAHFATFPTIIPKRAILAGTSERGHCPKCGTGWVRQTEVSYQEAGRGNNNMARKGADFEPTMASRPYEVRKLKHTETLGWQPSCDCGEEDTCPATVLDPFAGSGTTLAVALSLGRRAIGVELNPEYICIAHKRIAPFAAQELLTF